MNYNRNKLRKFETCDRPMASDINRVIEAVWRIESARLLAGLTRIVRDVGVAEDLAQGALVAALIGSS